MELEDLETSQTPLVQQFRQAYDVVQQKLRAAELDLPRLEELVEQPRGVQHKLSEKRSQALLQQLRSGLSKKQRQRLDLYGREGGAWISCVPKTPEQQLSRADFRQRIFARLEMQLWGTSDFEHTMPSR